MCCLANKKPPGTEVPKGLGGHQYKVFNCPTTKQILEWDKKRSASLGLKGEPTAKDGRWTDEF